MISLGSGSWCPECGPDVMVDEDALCASCGATCTGPGADQALTLRSELEAAKNGLAYWEGIRNENTTLRDQLAAARVSLEAMVENARRVQDQRDALKAALADTERNVSTVCNAMEMGGYPKRARAVLAALRRRAGLES